MKPQEALAFFGMRTKIAEICNITPTAVGHWFKQGWIHYDKQCVLEVESLKIPRKDRAGRVPLVASWDDVPEDKRRVAA